MFIIAPEYKKSKDVILMLNFAEQAMRIPEDGLGSRRLDNSKGVMQVDGRDYPYKTIIYSIGRADDTDDDNTGESFYKSTFIGVPAVIYGENISDPDGNTAPRAFHFMNWPEYSTVKVNFPQ